MSTDMLSANAMQRRTEERAGRSVAGPAHARLTQLAAMRGGAPVMQREIDDQTVYIEEAPELVRSLSADARARLHAVMERLIAAIADDDRIKVASIRVAIEQEGGRATFREGVSDIVGENPAVTSTDDKIIHIVIQRPFAESATKGELYGLLAHEVGVHNIPTDFQKIADHGVNAYAPLITPRKQEKGNTESGGYERVPWPENHQHPRHLNRQHDHLLVGNIVNRQDDGIADLALARAESYLQTMLKLGDAIQAGDGTNREKAEETTDLVHFYLVDIARIIATDDQRMPAARHLGAISDVYHWVFTNVILPEQAGHPWIPDEAPRSFSAILAGSLIALVARIKFSKLFDNRPR